MSLQHVASQPAWRVAPRPVTAYPFTGQLYRLTCKHRLSMGAYVGINGPHDRYGTVLSSHPADGGWCHLVRGTKQRQGERVQVNF